MRPYSRKNPAAFTLIELMITVAIIALLTGATVYSFASPIRSARARDAIDLIRAADADARAAARGFGRPVTLVVNVADGVIERYKDDALTSRAAIGAWVGLSGVRLGGRSQDAEQRVIRISPLGFSASYAVELNAGGDSGTRWLVFAGLTGQMTEVTDESQLKNMLASR